MYSQRTAHYPSHEALMRYARVLGFGDIHTKIDRTTGLYAIVAIHSTLLGPAIGGCRFHSYPATGPALKDALRLSFMMTLKAAGCGLPHGGAKAVILKPRGYFDREKLFESFGQFVEQIGGRYVTAMDVGTTTSDMDLIARRTSFVIGAAGTHAMHGDPGPFTALGVLRGIQAAVHFKFRKDNLQNIHVVIQGVGSVGRELCRLLHERGAKLTVYDQNTEAAEYCSKHFGAVITTAENIYKVPCDVFAPCALGGTINSANLQHLNTKIIAGCANNQLAHRKYDSVLQQKDILYAPDFIINAGGLIHAALTYSEKFDEVIKKIDLIYDTLLTIFVRAQAENKPTGEIAELLAIEKLKIAQQEKK